ncbi:hypothetical protein K7X08_033609 [Anisodus acutangulus]|uniref:Uncharacterized protein n=1 Tax=Anisodus acutangulus TaxID=402998 RepID=A0A9Q1RDE1_9SOLA|nr:hypothetical protein K7X08_033609 [Anisodus acutangulus]
MLTAKGSSPLVRFPIKYPSSSPSSESNNQPEVSTSEALQRQLQQLFSQHDSGLDQAFIDALPVFVYKEVVGPTKEPFDCAVCFDFDDPIEEGDHVLSPAQKTIEIEERRSVVDKSTFPVRLGKFKKLNVGAEEGEGETSSSNLDARRCYSLGSYQYVVGDFNLMVDLSSEQNVYDVKLAKLRERCANLSSAEGDGEGKRIEVMVFVEMLHEQSTLCGNKLNCRVDPYLYDVIAFI